MTNSGSGAQRRLSPHSNGHRFAAAPTRKLRYDTLSVSQFSWGAAQFVTPLELKETPVIESAVAFTLFDKVLAGIGLLREGKKHRTEKTDQALFALYAALAESRAYIPTELTGNAAIMSESFPSQSSGMQRLSPCEKSTLSLQNVASSKGATGWSLIPGIRSKYRRRASQSRVYLKKLVNSWCDESSSKSAFERDAPKAARPSI